MSWAALRESPPGIRFAAALGVGFCTGYCIANFVKGDSDDYRSAIDRYGEEEKQYTSRGMVSAGAPMAAQSMSPRLDNGKHDSGPSFLQKVANTHAFERVRDEAGNIGDAIVQELSKTAKTVVLPTLITSLRNFIGDYLPNAEKRPSHQSERRPSYQPELERNPS